MIFAVFDV